MREDIQKAIKEYEIATTPFFKKEAEAAEKYLGTEEKVILCLEANFCISYPDPTKKTALYGIVLVTNKRVFIYYKPKKEGLIDEMLLGEITDIKVFSPSLYDDHIQVYSADKIYDFPIRTKQRGLVISMTQSKQPLRKYTAPFYLPEILTVSENQKFQNPKIQNPKIPPFHLTFPNKSKNYPR